MPGLDYHLSGTLKRSNRPGQRTAIIGQLSSSLQGLIYGEGNSVT